MSKDIKNLKRKLRIFEIYFILLSILLIISITLSYLSILEIKKEPTTKYIPIIKYVERNKEPSDSVKYNQSLSNKIRYSYMKIPAVMDNSSAFVIAHLYIMPGKGNIFLNVKDTLIDDDTQQSIRKAIDYATKHENVDKNKYDYFITINSNAAVLTGPSAGATFTILTISALRNKIPKQDVMMTGTISNTGRIGLSGKVYEKAIAAKNAGAKIFLVPKGLSKEYQVIQQEECSNYGEKVYCDVIEFVKIEDLQDKVGIVIKEISTIDEALPYFGI